MKRKRGNKKGKSKKPPVVGVNDVAPSIDNLSTEDNFGLDDSDKDEFDSGMEAETPSSTGTDQPEKLASISSSGPIDKTPGNLVYGRVKVKIKTSKALDSRLTCSDAPTQSDTDKSIPQVGLEKQVVSEKMEDSANSLPEINRGVLGTQSKKAGSIKIKSRAFSSSSLSPCNNAGVTQGETIHQELLRRDPQHNKQQLNAALEVIKKIMKMDAAEPFNVPVNPIALGIPDYFDVIDTPMDFGTICSNLENGVKYMNSADVLKDVQYIWENCFKYNNKGDCILDLMKWVKKNFAKYWAAAGLYGEQTQGVTGTESIQATDVAPSSHGKMPLKGGQLKHKTRKRHGSIMPTKCPYHPVGVGGSQDSQAETTRPCAQTSIGSHQSQPESSQSTTSQPSDNMIGHASSAEVTPLPNQNGPATSMKRRGLAKPWKEWDNGKKLIIGWNHDCQPIEPNGKKLASQLGYFARQGSLFPLDLEDWRKVSEESFDVVWKSVKRNTNAPEGFKTICFQMVGNAWRRFKYRMKKDYFEAYDNDIERLANAPLQVDPDIWPKLVTYWGEEDTVRVAAQNTENRANLCAHPRIGRTSIPQVVEKMKKANLPTDKLSVYRETRKLKDKTYSTKDGAAGIEESIQRQLDAIQEQQNDPEVRDQIFEDVIGRDGHGHALCRGVGIRPTSVRSMSSHFFESEIKRLQKRIEEGETRHRQEMDELKELISQTTNKLFRMIQNAGFPLPPDDSPSTSNVQL